MTPVPALYFSSYALSLLGNSIAAIALPLLLLQTTGSLLSAGTLAAATAIPAFLVGLVSGVVIDRINRLTSSIISDLISAAAIAALPVIDALSGLNLGWFILFGIIGALGDVPGLTAREALLPAIVRHSRLSTERLVGIRESIGALMVVIGPAAAGGLILVFDGATVLWITAATSLVAALVTLMIPRTVGCLPGSADSSPAVSARAQLAEGWQVLFRHNRQLRAVTVITLAMVTALAALQGILLPAHFIDLGEPGLLGFVLTSLAAGTLLGGGFYAIAGTRGGGHRRAWFLSGLTGTVAAIALLGMLPAAALIFVGAFVLGAASGVLGSVTGVLMMESIPEHLRGRIIGTQNSLMMLAAPLGIVVVAVLGEQFGLRTAGITVAALWAIVALWGMLGRPLRNLGTASALSAEQPAGAGIRQ